MRALVLALAALIFASPLSAETPRTLNVYAAASLTEAFKQIGRQFERSHPGVKVRFNFAASNVLAIQINEGAPADLFASANDRTMDLVARRCGIETSQILVRNKLVVVVPKDNPARIRRIEDLARPGVKLVLAARGVPAGDFAREAFRRAGILDAALRNVVSNEQNVRMALSKVALGEADAGVVYASDAKVRREIIAIPIPDTINPIATYPIAVLKSAPNPDLARAFFNFAATSSAKNLFRSYGFIAN